MIEWKGTLGTVGRLKMVTTTVENRIEDLQGIKKDLPYNPAIPFLGMFPKEMKTLSQEVICTPIFIAALFTITRTWKQPCFHCCEYPPMNKWIKKL